MKKHLFLLCFFLTTLTIGYSQNYILYGLTSIGGNGSKTAGGTLFGYNINTSTFTVFCDFSNTNASAPVSSLILANNGLLYGTTTGGVSGGTLFSFNRVSYAVSILISFDGIDGNYPLNSPMQASNGKLYGTTDNGGNFGDGVVYSYDITNLKDSTVIEFIHSMTGGGDIQCNLVQDSTVGGGLLYGMTEGIGSTSGTIFSYNPVTGKDTVVHSFSSSPDSIDFPEGSLIQASNGLLYGACQNGGINLVGGLFSYNTHTNVFIHLLDFDTLIYPPYSGVFLDGKNGFLYWLSYANGGGAPSYSRGGICCYNISTNKDSLIYRFDSIHGKNPYGSLILDTANGLMYGMTSAGGKYNGGVLFSFNPLTGNETVLVDLDSITGSFPYLDLLLLPDTSTEAINELKANSDKLKIFPNPFSYSTTISIIDNGQLAMDNYLELYDLTGQKLKQVEFTGNSYTLSAEGLAKGMYFVRIFDKDKNVIGTSKIAVQ